MEALLPFLSLAGSVFSTVLTVYLWLVNMRRERANLRLYLIDRELFLGNGTAEQRDLGVKFAIVVVFVAVIVMIVLAIFRDRSRRKHEAEEL